MYAAHVHYALRASAGLRFTLEAGTDLTLLRFLAASNPYDGRRAQLINDHRPYTMAIVHSASLRNE